MFNSVQVVLGFVWFVQVSLATVCSVQVSAATIWSIHFNPPIELKLEIAAMVDWPRFTFVPTELKFATAFKFATALTINCPVELELENAF